MVQNTLNTTVFSVFNSNIAKGVQSRTHQNSSDDAEQEKSLILQAQNGDSRAMQQLLSDNEGWIAVLAQLYLTNRIEMDELMNCGRVGMYKAILKYDPQHGAKLITYATSYIKNEMREAVSDFANFIKLPENQIKHRGKIVKFMNKYAANHDGDMPDSQTIADEMGMSEQTVSDILTCSFTVSLDEPLNTQHGNMYIPVSDRLDDAYNYGAPNGFDNHETTCDILIGELDAKLSTRDKQIVSDYYGISGNGKMTYEKIAAKYGLSIEGVRKIIKRATNTLSESKELQELM